VTQPSVQASRVHEEEALELTRALTARLEELADQTR